MLKNLFIEFKFNFLLKKLPYDKTYDTYSEKNGDFQENTVTFSENGKSRKSYDKTYDRFLRSQNLLCKSWG